MSAAGKRSLTNIFSGHHAQRNHVNQVYFRRFFCDYKSTSNMTEEEFSKNYQREEIIRLAELKNKRHESLKPLILRKTRSKNYPKTDSNKPGSKLKDETGGKSEGPVGRKDLSTEENISQ